MDFRYLTRDGDRLDLICWQRYGHLRNSVETVLAANPGIAALGPLLPAGISLRLPAIEQQRARPRLELWR